MRAAFEFAWWSLGSVCAVLGLHMLGLSWLTLGGLGLLWVASAVFSAADRLTDGVDL